MNAFPTHVLPSPQACRFSPVLPLAMESLSTPSSSAPSLTLSQSSSNADVDAESTAEALYRIASIPHKGRGLVANQAIRKGTVVLFEPPLLIQPATRTNSSILAALSRHSRDDQCTFFTLANVHGRALLPALGIFETNALPCDNAPAAPGLERMGLFLTASRINHSCSPNLSRTWDVTAQAMTFRALRHIAEGEELCIHYGDVLATREDRRNTMSDIFGFDCVCNMCILEGEALFESDRRRTTIRRLFDEVSRCMKEPTLGMRKVKLALRLLGEEHLAHYDASFCFDAFQFCALVSDFANAKAWVRKAWEASCSMSGPESPAAHTFKMYWANPRAHRFSGKLPKMTLAGPDLK